MRVSISAAQAAPFHDRRVLLVDRDLSGAAEDIERHGLELKAEFLRDHRAACQKRDILQDRACASSP